MKTEKILSERINMSDKPESSIKGHVIFRDGKTKEILHEEDNLVLMRARVWLFEQLFKVNPPTSYAPPAVINNNRSVVLYSIGSGGADVNASAFTPYTPKFSDSQLGQAIPFVIVDPDKNNDVSTQSNPSIVESLTPDQAKTYYMSQKKADGTTAYYGKRFKGATDTSALGSSTGWNIDTTSGTVSFSLSLSIDEIDARGLMFNEIALWLGQFNSSNNTYKDLEMITRLTFSTVSLQSLTSTIDIEYILYI